MPSGSTIVSFVQFIDIVSPDLVGCGIVGNAKRCPQSHSLSIHIGEGTYLVD